MNGFLAPKYSVRMDRGSNNVFATYNFVFIWAVTEEFIEKYLRGNKAIVAPVIKAAAAKG